MGQKGKVVQHPEWTVYLLSKLIGSGTTDISLFIIIRSTARQSCKMTSISGWKTKMLSKLEMERGKNFEVVLKVWSTTKHEYTCHTTDYKQTRGLIMLPYKEYNGLILCLMGLFPVLDFTANCHYRHAPRHLEDHITMLE